MCGIIGYYGEKNSVPILIKGLKRLEYRGYDSAGIAVMNSDGIQSIKKAGKVSVLNKEIDDARLNGSIGMGHTRWATHGEPNDKNAHPHWDHSGKIAIVHNGIIENYSAIKQVLVSKGVEFKSDTDTEVLVQLISDFYYNEGLAFERAVQVALNQVVGAYGIVTFCSEEPDKLVAARSGSPLVLGLGENEYFIASDASPIVDYTRNVVYLDEGEMLTITRDGHEIRSIKDDSVVNKLVTIAADRKRPVRSHRNEASRGTRRHQETPGGTQRHRQAPRGIKRHQKAPGGSKKSRRIKKNGLQVSGFIVKCL